MARSAGVTASSIIALIGSCLTVLWVGLMTLAVHAAPIPVSPGFVKIVLVGSALIGLAAGLWGIASGIGLLRLREWARISMLVFGVVLILFCLPTGLLIPFLPMTPPPNSPMPPGFFALIRIVMAIIYLALAALGICWVWFFNRKTVKEQFCPGVTSSSQSTQPGRPISISIMGWCFLVCGCFTPLALLLHMPVMFFGFLFTGRTASVLILGFGIISIIMGVGLLMLRPWARILAICYFVLCALSSLSFVMVPGAAARLQTMTVVVQSRMNLPQAPPPLPTWFFALAGLPVLIVLLWFVITRKAAFTPSRPELSAPES